MQARKLRNDFELAVTIKTWKKHVVIWLFCIGLVAVVTMHAYQWATNKAYEQIEDFAAGQLDLYAAALENELGKHAYLACLLAGDPDIAQLIQAAPSRQLQNKASNKLIKTSVTSGILGAWLLDANARVLASSDAASPFGKKFLSLGVAQRALQGQESRGVQGDVQSGSPEYLFACPVFHAEKSVGAVVIAVSLAPMEATWTGLALRSESDKPVVVDALGAIVLSSVAAWKSQTAEQLLPNRLGVVGLGVSKGNQQDASYWTISPARAGALSVRAMVRVDDQAQAYPAVVHRRTLPRFGWHLLVFSHAAAVDRDAQLIAGVTAAVCTAALLLYLVWHQRRRVIEQKLLTRQALQQANDQLERTVLQRTEELHQSNAELQHEITVRLRAESVLREAQDELIQASKMALLGQMSASISHEVGQPLTAMRALAANAKLLLMQGRHEDVLGNLSNMIELVERMGRITTQLKSFARKGSPSQTQVHLTVAVHNAVELLRGRWQETNVQLRVDVPEPLWVVCDGNRLEQVLINLMVNAIDAMQNAQTKNLTVMACTQKDRVKVSIHDTGSGIAAEQREHLFEPFFTTKSTGLGLGLVISASIIHEFGGELVAIDVPQGATFEFDLPLLNRPIP